VTNPATSTIPSAPTRGRAATVLLIAGFVLAAFNMRPALAGISPLLGQIMADTGLSPAGAGAITTVMVVCLGVLAPLAPLLSARVGLDRTLLAGLLILTSGVVLRSLDGLVGLYLGAAVAGTAIAIMNVIMPAAVKQHFPDRIGLLTSVYVTGLVVGAAAASGLMVPLQQVTGYGWRVIAASAAVPALAAALLWLPQAVRAPARPSAPARRRLYHSLLRRPITWHVTAYMGLQSFVFYATLAWLPTVFTDAGFPVDHAGYLLGLAQLVPVAATLTVPVHAGRFRTQVPHILISSVLTIAGLAAVWLAPATMPWAWMIVLGLGQGASIALALLIITLRAPDPESVTALSAVAQGVGYVLAAAGPVLIGLLHEFSGGWGVPFAVLIGVCVAQTVFGWFAGRPSPR